MGSREHECLIGTIAGIGMRDISVGHKILCIDLSRSQRTVLAVQLILQACLISRTGIKVTNAALVRSGNDTSNRQLIFFS